jgi:transcriptional regulator with XRE-family HTH domain
MSYVLPAFMRKAGGMATHTEPKPHTYDSAAFGKAIKVVLAEKGLSQRKLAERSCMPYRRVNSILQGHGNPTYKTMKRLCVPLAVSLGELLVRAERIARDSKPRPAEALKVGDQIASSLPGIDWKGVVAENRGAFAPDGSQIVAIRLDFEPDYPPFDVRADDLERVETKTRM